MRSLQLAFRTLARSPIVSAVAVLSLALDIGANAAIYSLFEQMVLRALPVHEPGGLVNLANPGPRRAPSPAGRRETVTRSSVIRCSATSRSGRGPDSRASRPT